jgi:hypothetical protein
VLEGSLAGTHTGDESDSPSQRSEISPTRNRTAGRPKVRGTKFADLLDGLETCLLSSLKNLPRSSHPTHTALDTPAGVPGSAGAMGTDVSMRSFNHAQGILESLRGLDQLDSRVLGLSVATNFAYWKLGEAYETFCEVSQNSL